MSVILVAEQDASYAERIVEVLCSAGWDAKAVANRETAFEAANTQRPGLLIASASLPDASSLLAAFSRNRGGPGSVVLVPVAVAGRVSAADYQADALLDKPFSDDSLTQIVRRCLGEEDQPTSTEPPRQPPGQPPGPAKSAGQQLTSEDIFGDVLAEVEAEARRSEATRRQRAIRSSDDIERKLEETLSGVFPLAGRPKRPSPTEGTAPANPRTTPVPAEPRKPRSRVGLPSDDEIDDLLDKTLSSLELPKRLRKTKVKGGPQPSPLPSPQPTESTVVADVDPVPPPPEAQLPQVSSPPATTAAAEEIKPSSPSSATAWEGFEPPPELFPTSFDPVPNETPNEEPATPSPEPESPTQSAAESNDALSMGEIPLPNFFTLAPEDSPLSEAAESIPQRYTTDAPSEHFNTENAVLPPVETFDVHPIEIPETPPPEPTSTLSDDLTFDLFPASFGAVDPSSPEPPQPDLGTDLPAELFPTSFGEDPPPSSLKTLSDVPPPPELTAPIASPPPAAGLETLRMPAIGATSFLEEEANPTARSSGATYPIIPQSAPAQSFTDKNATNKAIAKNEPFSTHRMVALENISAPPSKEGETFGDYTLIDRVAVGGMAEVWRARRRGVEGFQKTVAIKRILSHLTDTPDFITMFIDEAKLAAQLSHNHIIQIYDLGKVGDDFFIAMEFVDGKDLRSILDKARKLGRPLPIELALMIVAALARALDYAHRKKDFENRAMGLVHRDVSPQNVLISYEGEIKLCDFGIVKAVAKASTTQMGALKGKLQYMSPEQAWGKSVDGRSDIFSLGSVLFEVLTGERLFTGDSELNVLDSVRECRVRSPRDLVPDIPKEVDQIVHRALTATPEERYQTAKELEQDIKSALDSLRLTPSQGDLATYVGQLFNPPLEFHNYEAADTPAAPPSSEEASPTDGEAQALPNVKPSTKADSQRPRKWLLPTLLVLALAAITALAWFAMSNRSRSSPEPTTAPTDIATPEETKPAVQDGEPDSKEAAEDGAVDPEKSAEADARPEEGVNAEAGTARGTSTTGEATNEATMEEGSPPPESRETSLVDRLVEERLAETEREIQRKYDAQLEAESQRLKRELERAQKNLKDPPKPPPQEMNPDQFDTEESDGR